MCVKNLLGVAENTTSRARKRCRSILCTEAFEVPMQKKFAKFDGGFLRRYPRVGLFRTQSSSLGSFYMTRHRDNSLEATTNYHRTRPAIDRASRHLRWLTNRSRGRLRENTFQPKRFLKRTHAHPRYWRLLRVYESQKKASTDQRSRLQLTFSFRLELTQIVRDIR